MYKNGQGRVIEWRTDKFREKGEFDVPSKLFTVGQVVDVATVHVPHQGKVTFVDIVDDENKAVRYRYRYRATKFHKYAKHVERGTLVVVEGTIATDTLLKPPDAQCSTILVDGETFRILQRPRTKTISLDEALPAWTVDDGSA